ncbi:hypothetical protein KKG29_02225 [Patescibacteria group bacterium]|nr:hypothetical protein [Patescibacteria group bacterium]MBU3999973.1 hypothetical protein [Patescibacteria group bacterium]MBU4056567.1 hypothetical protein [Patescibacteria group bacterium]MBU4368414.1 hypothetical protein [Patescibacteria group bacterium]
MPGKNFFSAIAMLAGTIVGAGIFALPYTAAKSGLVATIFYLIFLTAVVVLIHLLYGEVVFRTNGQHRLVGYANIYLGKWGKRLSTISVMAGSYAALLVYLILGGKFLFIIFSNAFGGTEFVYTFVLFLVSAIFIALGFGMVSRLELALSVVLLLAIFIFLFKGSFLIDPSNFSLMVNWQEIFLPYGVILFAFGGVSIIPEMVKILKGEELKLKRAIICGTLIPAVIYFFFIIVVLGVSGAQTSEAAIVGLEPFLGRGVTILGAVIGFLAIITSYIAYGVNFKRTFQYDYNLSRFASFFLAVCAPFVLFSAGLDNFIRIISFTGAVMSGIDGILIILMYRVADRGGKGDRKPEYDIITSKWLEYLLIAIFIAGIVYTILNP